MNTLYLTDKESSLFTTLASEVTEGWQVEAEVLPIQDTPEKRVVRMSLLRIRDPKLVMVQQSAKSGDINTVIDAVKNHDLADVHEEDLKQIFFALGPVVVTKLIESMLPEAKTDQDIEGITALTVIRHALLSARQPS